MARISTGKVKLRSSTNGMMFTVPKKIVDEARLVSDTMFVCDYEHLPGVGLEITFRRSFKVRLNNGH